MNKKNITLIIIIVVAASIAGFFLRERIVYLFKANIEAPPPTSVSPTPSPITAEPSPNAPPDVIGKPSPLSQIRPKYPPYSGRDPKEVRPLPEEVKLFTEDQKSKLYAEIENYADAVKKDPNFFNGWIQGGLLKKVIGDFEGARDMWEYANIIRPQNATSFANLGELYWRYLANFPKSEANFRTAIKNKPSDLMTYISLSDLYFYSYAAKAHLADDVLLEGMARNPTDVNLMKALASLYERQKEYAKTLEWWKKVLASEPGNTAVAAAIKALEEKVK